MLERWQAFISDAVAAINLNSLFLGFNFSFKSILTGCDLDTFVCHLCYKQTSNFEQISSFVIQCAKNPARLRDGRCLFRMLRRLFSAFVS